MNLRPLQKATNERSDTTRRRLIEAGLDLFGLYGYEGATTRALAERAEVNLAAIPYHFGGKDGLYRAVAQAVLEGLNTQMNGFIDEVESEITDGVVSPHQAMVLAERLLSDFSEIVLMRPETDRWVRFILREQMEPTEVFETLYENPIKRMRGMLTQLLASISGLETDHVRLRLTALDLLGLVYVFRVAQSSVLREMGWTKIDAVEFNEMRSVILDNARMILRGLQARGRA